MDKTFALINRAHDGDKEAFDQLVQDNLGLVWSIVRRFTGRGYEADDLFQIGSIGLIKAINKFDVSLELRLSTYAVPMITGEIKRFLRDDGMIKVSRSIKENGWKVKRAAQDLGTRLGREATVEELSDEVGITVEEIAMAMEATTEVESIYKTVYQGDGSSLSLADRLPEKRDDTETCLNHMLMEQLLMTLDTMERELIMLRYFEEKTQTDIAEHFGISQVQVSRMEKKILRRLRDKID